MNPEKVRGGLGQRGIMRHVSDKYAAISGIQALSASLEIPQDLTRPYLTQALRRRRTMHCLLSKDAVAGEAEILPFSETWMEGYIDLLEGIDTRDPLYSREVRTRDQIRSRVKLQIAAGSTKVHLLAVDQGKVVGSARGILIPTCGDEAARVATLNLLVAQTHRGRGIGTRLTNIVCDELKSHGAKGLEMGVIESWEDWKRFLGKLGFVPHDKFYDVVLTPDVPLEQRLPDVPAVIRPVRLPEDRSRIIELFNRERSKDLPRECRVVPGQPAWWETEPESSNLDPDGFLLADDERTGDLAGFVDSYFFGGKKPWGLIGYIDVAERFLGTRLRERLLLESLRWLRGKGTVEIKSRCHPDYRDEAALFEKAGFKVVNPAVVWRKTLS